jgi:HSP20 family protein
MLERSSGSFSRTINLPDNVKEDDIDASYSKGVLTLTIPKSHETESKKINVKIS